MQVPTTITLNNGHQRNHSNYFVENATFAMEMPDKLTSNLENFMKLFVFFL